MNKLELLIMPLMATSLLASCNKVEPVQENNNTFAFKSDYCVLDNKEIYESNTKVNLNLTITEEYKDTYLLPDDIEVLLGSKTGVKDSDYQYIIKEDKKSASLSMVVNANIVVRVMYKDSDNIHLVTEKQFNQAMAMENIPFIQHEYEYYRYYYGGDTAINLNRIDYISPTVNYHFTSNIIKTSGIKEIETEPKFYSKNGEEKYQYNYDKETKTWSKDGSEPEKIPFLVSSDVSPIKDQTISEYLTYERLKDCYNKETSLYNYFVTKDNHKYTFTLSFNENRLMSLSYETDAEDGYLCYISYSYFAIKPDLPPVTETNVTNTQIKHTN